MASWLKVAEDLFEVVDRRAKLVVNELADEQSSSHQSASNNQEVQAGKSISKEKGHSRSRSVESSKGLIPLQDLQSIQSSVPRQPGKVETAADRDSFGTATANSNLIEGNTTEPSDCNNDVFIGSTTDGNKSSKGASVTENVREIPVLENHKEASTSSPAGNAISNSNGAQEDSSTSSFQAKEAEVDNGDQKVNDKSKVGLFDKDSSVEVKQENPAPEKLQSQTSTNTEDSDHKHSEESSSNSKVEQGNKTESSLKKVEDQLDEAHGLLKNTISTGQSKEARLARICAGLSSRLQGYKSENAQLEELLVAERELSSSYEARIKQLQQELSVTKAELARVESNMADALAAKYYEIETLVGSLDSLKKQAASSEGKLAALQAHMEDIMRSRELSETRMIQALREELASVERRAEEERAAHNATKMAAVEREVELGHRAVEASNALARMQRAADEGQARAAELEHKVTLLEVECASLHQELQDMEARNRRGPKKTDDANQMLQMQALQEEVERARQSQRDAENKISSLEAELQKMRVEMAGMKRDAEHYSLQEHMELEKRYRELTDLLYHKQTQLEAMASEKAAAQFQLEKEIKRLHEIQVEAERGKVSRRASSFWEEDTDLKALEPLPLRHRHMAAANVQLQKAAKLLDSGAVKATRFLWRYPVARIILLFYLVFVHLFLMHLLHRLQVEADKFAASEVAASMGLSKSSLP